MTTSVGERFWSKVDIRGFDSCWLWTASTSAGYGQFWRNHRDKVVAHRWTYALFVGPIPDGMVVDHTCHNQDTTCAGGRGCPHRACVNPAHLRLATPGENVLAGKGRSAEKARQTLCIRGHELVYDPRSKNRVCPTCKHERAIRNGKARRARKKAAALATLDEHA